MSSHSPPRAWITAREAASITGLSRDAVWWWARNGRLAGRLHEGRWQLDPTDVQRLAAERADSTYQWVSYVEAAEMLGVTPRAIRAMIARGELVSRSEGRRWIRGLNRAQVLALATSRRKAEAARERDAANRAAARSAGSPPEPVAGDAWLDLGATAAVLQISRSRVQQLAARDRVPCVRRGRRPWFRRSHIESMAAARAWAALQRHARD